MMRHAVLGLRFSRMCINRQLLIRCSSTLPPVILPRMAAPAAMKSRKLLQSSLPIFTLQRSMWAMLNAIFNRPDNNRIKEVGPDRACAEWCLRCGAHVKWMDMDKWHTDYNTLPAGNFQKFKIAEINADNAAVMEIGFPHLAGLKHLKKIRFHYCAYLGDESIMQLHHVKDSLEHLEIGSCGDISHDGLMSLTQLKNLKTIMLYDLPNVRDKESALKKLQEALPDCQIEFKDIEREKKGKT